MRRMGTFATRSSKRSATVADTCSVHKGDENDWNGIGRNTHGGKTEALKRAVQIRLIQQYTQQCFLATDHTPAWYAMSFDFPSGHAQDSMGCGRNKASL